MRIWSWRWVVREERVDDYPAVNTIAYRQYLSPPFLLAVSKCPFEFPVLWKVVSDSHVQVCSESTLGFLLPEHWSCSMAAASQLSVSSTVLSVLPRRQRLFSLYCQYQRQGLTTAASSHFCKHSSTLAIYYHGFSNIDTSRLVGTQVVSAFMEPPYLVSAIKGTRDRSIQEVMPTLRVGTWKPKKKKSHWPKEEWKFLRSFIVVQRVGFH